MIDVLVHTQSCKEKGTTCFTCQCRRGERQRVKTKANSINDLGEMSPSHGEMCPSGLVESQALKAGKGG